MTEIQEYDDQHVRRGPFAIANAGDGHGLVALSDGARCAVRVSAAQIPSFFSHHAAEFFVGVDVAEVIRSLVQDAVSREFCNRVIWDGRLVDLRLLDRQINGCLKIRNWSEILADGSRQVSDDLTVHLLSILKTFERLRFDAARIATEIGPLPSPPFDVIEGNVPNLAEGTQFLEHLMREAALSMPRANASSSRKPTADSALDIARTQEHNGLLGNHIAIWAAVGFDDKHMPGFRIDESRLADFRSRVDTEFQRSCSLLRSNKEALREVEWVIIP